MKNSKLEDSNKELLEACWQAKDAIKLLYQVYPDHLTGALLKAYDALDEAISNATK